MENVYELRPVARISSDFGEKFGIPRQSGLAPELRARVVFEPEFRNPDCVRGLEGFSHLWLIWGFSANRDRGWSPTVRPPRLGGNERMGVFATRSPFRPNPIGLSCVELLAVEPGSLLIAGADLMDGTPIFDIKPYVPYADAHPEAVGGFAAAAPEKQLTVELPETSSLPEEKRAALISVLSCDPRPAYQRDPERRYALTFAGFTVRFFVDGERLVVEEIE